MRILYFTRDYTTHDYRFLTSLAGSEHEVFSLRLEKRTFRYEERSLPERIRQISWVGGGAPVSAAASLQFLPDLKRVIKEYKPDLIHAGPIPSTAFLTALAGFRPLVSMSWGSDLLYEVDHNRSVFQSAMTALDGTTVMVCDCEAVQKKAAAFGFPAEKVVIFPWGIDLNQFSLGYGKELRSKIGWDRSHFVLLSARSWEPIYRVDLTVKAFSRAAKHFPELRLLLLGGGSQESLIRRLVNECAVQDKVHFAGQINQNDLPAYYRSSDLYISSSHSDGSSVSLMEALACGIPALVSDIPGNAEWIKPGNQGWLFRDGDVCDLQNQIEAICSEKGKLPSIAGAARKLAEERADWNKNFQKLLFAYQMAGSK